MYARSERLVVPTPYDVELFGRAVRPQPEGPSSDSAESLEALAELVLASAERKVWRALVDRPRRRRHWFLGRVAAKDAVRQLVLDCTGRALSRAEVAILAGPLGSPSADIGAASADALRVMVSIAHIDEVAVAIACADFGVHGIGIDVERCRGRRGIERIGLNEPERRGLRCLPLEVRVDRSVRMWCAKEAVAKALGTGLSLLGGPRALTVERLDEHAARLRVVVPASAARGTRAVEAATRRDGDLVLATALTRRTQFGATDRSSR